jgi:ubiquinone biosynthesis protein
MPDESLTETDEKAAASENKTSSPASDAPAVWGSEAIRPAGDFKPGRRRPSRRSRERLPLPLYAVARTVWLVILSLIFLPQLLLDGRVAPLILRRYLEVCSGGFIKLGQILAMRYDVLPAEYCDELSKLLDRVPAAPLSTIERIIAEDLGRPVAACFRSLDEVPMGSASIAQVHGARLAGGEPVAVKVVRPGIARTLRVDMAYLGIAGRLSSRFGILRSLNLEALVRELSDLTHEELDFRREARNAALFHRLLAEDEVDHYAPRVFFSLSGPRVITMERIAGVPMTELLAAVHLDDRPRLRQWAARGIRPRRTARLLLRSILEQAMRHRTFNADPHPANLIVQDGGTLAWVDFGAVGWLDEHTWGQLFRLQEAIATRQIQAAVEALLASLAPLPARDLSWFELEAKAILRDWVDSSRDSDATVLEKSTGRFLLRIFAAIRRAGLSLPADLVRVYRTVIIGDMIMLRLDPNIDWVPELRDFVAHETGRQLKQALRPEVSIGAVAAATQAWLRFFSTTFNLVNWLDVRLPELARSYQREFSHIERAGVLLLRYARALILVFVALVVLALIPQTRVNGLAALNEHTGHYALPIVLAGVAAVVVLSRLVGELKPR